MLSQYEAWVLSRNRHLERRAPVRGQNAILVGLVIGVAVLGFMLPRPRPADQTHATIATPTNPPLALARSPQRETTPALPD